MTTLSARVERLRVRAANNGRSMEAELRHIVSDALAGDKSRDNLAEAIRRRFAPLGGIDLPSHPRQPASEPPWFDE